MMMAFSPSNPCESETGGKQIPHLRSAIVSLLWFEIEEVSNNIETFRVRG